MGLGFRLPSLGLMPYMVFVEVAKSSIKQQGLKASASPTQFNLYT